jgi:hypothetical protein
LPWTATEINTEGGDPSLVIKFLRECQLRKQLAAKTTKKKRPPIMTSKEKFRGW